ncbi:hypothetical protein Vadar_022779 [Vaccinium darrowii]|uniref:Uncharacterized protein n=1 Tax=Vaccinium darrowii TaxID=229202 RepID=A0ACB7X328_9ERIC|nr:hypothetical protein Vadar_022779 [Vaccinium darrowii]
MLEKNEPQPWLLLVDGSKTKEAGGAGLVLQSLDGTKLNISQVPREENSEADQLARLATAKDELILRDVMIQYLENPSIAQPIVEVKVVERSFTLPYLRCLVKIEAEQAMNEVHEGICRGH